MALVVADAELLLDDRGDAGAGPDLASEAVGLRPVPEELRDQPLLGVGQLGRAARPGPGEQGLGAAVAGACQPAADGLLADAQRLGDVPLIPALLLQVQRPQPPPLTPVSRDVIRRSHTSILPCGSLVLGTVIGKGVRE